MMCLWAKLHVKWAFEHALLSVLVADMVAMEDMFEISLFPVEFPIKTDLNHVKS